MSLGLSLLMQSPSTPWRLIGEDILLAPIGRDDFDHLSGTAAVVWKLLETPSSIEEIIDIMAEMYSIPADEIAADVQTLVSDLVRSGTVQEVEAADA